MHAVHPATVFPPLAIASAIPITWPRQPAWPWPSYKARNVDSHCRTSGPLKRTWATDQPQRYRWPDILPERNARPEAPRRCRIERGQGRPRLFWHRDELGEFAEVLGCGCKVELITS